MSSALRPAGASAAAGSGAVGAGRRGSGFGSRPGRHVIAVSLAVPVKLERLPAVLPFDVYDAQLDGTRNLPGHLLILVVPGHGLEAILRA